MPGVMSAALQQGSASGSAQTGLGEKQAWKDVLVGREVPRGPVAQGDRLGRNADEECTGCPGNGAGTEASDCGCSGKDEGIGCLGDRVSKPTRPLAALVLSTALPMTLRRTRLPPPRTPVNRHTSTSKVTSNCQ